jgi:anti-sigma regulatory factor (Ser/Thr protein kinase)/GNAT superfamily N-acetyltransferase
VKITVLSDASAPSLVLALIPAFAAALGIPADDERRLAVVVEQLVAFTLDNAYPDDDLGEIEVAVDAGDGCVHVAVHDWGLPLTSAGGEFGPLPEALATLPPDAREVLLTNLGSNGKRLTAEVTVHSDGDGLARWHHIEAAPRRAPAGEGASDPIEVRAATPDDAEAIAQLLYENYHLSYVHADFYRPRYLMAALESGGLLSTIAVHDGRVIGHGALMPLPGVSSAESGAAVVHSAYRGLGVFGRVSGHTLDTAIERGLASIFGDAVTIHPFSQRAERANGFYETALQLGMVPAQTTMRGFGGKGPQRRTATIRSYRPFDEQPRRVQLPAVYRELLEGVYANVGLTTGTRSEPAGFDGDPVAVEIDEPRSLGFLRVRRSEGDAASGVRSAVHHLRSQHVDVAYADVDLMAVTDVNETTAQLNEHGFFAAGLVLHGLDGHDYLRLQMLDSEDIELEGCICDSAFAGTLMQRVLEDKARVGG